MFGDSPKGPLQIRAFARPPMRVIELYIFNGEQEVTSLNLANISNDGLMRKPSVEIRGPMAQQLMDDLWIAGLRPSEGSGSAGSLQATQKHLEDMRTLVFKTAPKS